MAFNFSQCVEVNTGLQFLYSTSFFLSWPYFWR